MRKKIGKRFDMALPKKRLDCMVVRVAKNAGFCKGVQNAVDTALSLVEKYGKIYTLGELVHNEQVTKYLQNKGAICIDVEKALDVLKEGDVALIRAHGITKQLEDALKAKGVVLFDATCKVVKHNRDIASERAALGDDIVIIGDKNHDEVVSLASYAGENVRIFADDENVVLGNKKTSVLFQTTILLSKFDKIKENINNFQKNNSNLVGIFNTICYTTTHRQDETRALAESSDAVLVLGSHTSANTRRLYEVAREVNPNVIFATCVEDVLSKQSFFKDIQSVSIVAGASTPPWLIREVTKLMSETQKNAAVETAENEVKNEATLQEQTTVESNEPTTMADLLESTKTAGYVNYKIGKRIRGKVISAGENGIYVAIGGKKDGFIDKSEASLDGNYNPADYNKDDEIQATILSVDKDCVKLSKKEVDAIRQEEELAEKALAAGEFSLTMTEVVKGGLRGKLGQYTIFVPASQIRMGYVSNLEDYKGKTLRLVIMPPKAKENEEGAEGEVAQEKATKKSKYLFASQRLILEREKQEKEDLFWNNIHVHDIVTGKVKRFTQFGAFVNVRGFDCLAHISELSWNKITDPSTVLTIGESYDFVVLKMDRETGKISLGFKQLQKKPYELAAEKFPVGTVIKGKVERIFPYGAFISIDDGVDGLVHVSQISHNWIKDANEALKVGEEVEAKIIGFDDNRITLSIKELLPAPEETAAQDVAEQESTDEEKAAKRSSRVKKFEQKVAEGENKRERRSAKKETSNEPKEWVSGTSSATLGDLFKNLNLNLADEEEQPQKKSRSKKADDAE